MTPLVLKQKFSCLCFFLFDQSCAVVQAGHVLTKTASYERNLVEIIEIPSHPWFVGCQFHPEFTSTPRDGHPLFNAFLTAALTYQCSKVAEVPDAVT